MASSRGSWERGFSYLWVLMAVALMSVGMVVAAEVYMTSARRENEKELLFIGRQFREAIARYYESMPGGAKHYPQSLDSLLRDPRFPGMRRHLRRIYIDPMTGKAEWGVLRVGKRIVGVHSVSVAAPLKVGNFEPADAGFAGKKKYSEWVFTHPPHLSVSGNFVATPFSADVVQTQRAQRTD